MKKGRILIVDDNITILKSLQLLLKSEFQNIDTISNPELIPSKFEKLNYDLILLDMNFKTGINTGNEGLFWLKKILELDKDAVVIMITAYGDVELAVKAIKSGASDFIQKPWDAERLIATLHSAYNLRKSKREISRLKNKQSVLQENIVSKQNPIIGKSKPMIEVFKMIQKVAKTNANILILGENGSGKDLIAKEIHRQSKRADEVFVDLDMGAINESLFESELFGHVKGSFTDAKENRIGKIEAASGGSLFLDEIGNLPISLQSKMLRVLQERKITPIGSNKSIDVDIRLISATNKSIDNLIENSLFREDLYFRLNTIEIKIPPLRERESDIVLLAEYYIKKYAKKYERNSVKLSTKALDKLISYHWPGNVRELKHSIEKAIILSENDILKPEDFFFKSYFEPQAKSSSIKLYDVEKEIIRKALHIHQGNLSKVAKEMEISRTTLYNKIKKYDL